MQWFREKSGKAKAGFKAWEVVFFFSSPHLSGVSSPAVATYRGFTVSANPVIQRWQYLAIPENFHTFFLVCSIRIELMA